MQTQRRDKKQFLKYQKQVASNIKSCFKFFYRKMVALQYCVDSCHTSTLISHRYTSVPSLLNPSPISHPIPCFQDVTEHQVEFLMLHSKFPLAINFTYGNVYVSRLFSQFVPPTSCPPVVHKSVYICVSIAALQIGSSVPSKCKLLCIAQQSIWPWPAFPALEKAMATHSSTLAWRILGMKEPDRLPSMRSHRVGHD